jgi:integrase
MDEQIKAANERLRKAGIRITIERKKESLYLRGILPAKPHSTRAEPHQQRIPLGVKAHAAGLKRAVQEAKRVDSDITLGRFDWGDWLESDVFLPPLAHEVVDRFEREYFARRARNRQTEDTYQSNYRDVFRRFGAEDRLSEEVLLALIKTTQPDSRTRLRFVTAVVALVDFAELPIPLKRIRALRGSYKAPARDPRSIPTDERILELWDCIEDPPLKLYFGYLAAFGIRPHELFYLDYSELQAGGRRLGILEGTKIKKFRWAYALPESWIPLFGLGVDLGLKPVEGLTNRRMGNQISKLFLRRNLGITPYDLRHAWRLRAVRAGIDPSVAAKSLGHSVAISQATYTAALSERESDLAFDRVRGTDLNAGSVDQSS